LRQSNLLSSDRTCLPDNSPPSSRHEIARVAHDLLRPGGSVQTRLLYGNATTGTVVTVIAALVLAYFQRLAIPDPIVLGWLLYTLVVAAARLELNWRYRRPRQRTRPAADGVWLCRGSWGGRGRLGVPRASCSFPKAGC
jgi:hypothetical protein